MKMSKKEKILEVTKILLIIIILSLVLNWLIPTVNSSNFRILVDKLGPLGPSVIVFYVVLSHVFAPLAGTPGLLLGVAVFGFYKTSIYIYLASLISATINFYIGRKYGRKWVMRLVGKKIINEVDNFVQASGTKILILSRIFGFSLFEVVSYAAGLTKIEFTKYFSITAIFSLIPSFIIILLFKDADFSSKLNLLIWFGIIIITGIIFSFFIKRSWKK